MSRAEKFLEGFKLGDLGAGKTRLADVPSQQGQTAPGQIQVLKDGFTDSEKKCPFFIWKENDGMKYAIVVNKTNMPSIFGVQFYGGSALSSLPDGVMNGGSDFFRNYDFIRYSAFTHPHSEVLEVFDEWLKSIKKKGSYGFASSAMFRKSKDKTDSRYNAWLKEKKKTSGD